ncbi:MAG TPA: hypothetical protein VN455_07940 [Methanotrichaceae archaeon]|nr:hypothetical protein [Methanotrichaceae archaeon]
MGDGFSWHVLVLIILASSCISEAKMGYDIAVNVNGLHWSRSQSTEFLNLRMDSACNGVGNSSKYVKITGLAGIGMKDTTHSSKGKLISEERLNLSSYWVSTDIEESYNISTHQFIADINETMPTFLSDENSLVYQGDGIYSRNLYQNNGDDISTDYLGSYLSKAIRYAGIYKNAKIHTVVGPTSVDETVFKNEAWAFRLSSESDTYSGLRYKGKDGILDDSYAGAFKVEEKMLKGFDFSTTEFEEKSEGWLECCPLLYSNQKKLNVDHIFESQSAPAA